MYQLSRSISAALLLFCTFICITPARAEGAHGLWDKITRAHSEGQAFTEASLFTIAADAPKHAGLLDAETILKPRTTEIAGLFATHPSAVSITVMTAAGKAYTLEMLRAYPTGDAPDMGTIDATGRHRAAYTPGIHYQGALAGDAHSIATMSVFQNGDVAMLFSNDEGNFNLGRLEDASGNFILYNDKDLRAPHKTSCATPDLPAGMMSTDGHTAGKSARPLLCNKVTVYWELAYNVYTSKVSLTTTQNYATSLFNQFQAMYANERIAMELSSLYIWTAQDDYPTTTSQAALYYFRSYWNSLSNGFVGDLAHVITRNNNGSGGKGGVAFLDGLCNSSAIAYSDIWGSVSTVPTWSWDVEVVTHETGHNLGSPHTHWCGWNTGSGGSCGAIDDCYTLESGSGCTTCGSTYSNSAPTTTWKGTVMSYCHLVSRGINLANGFGPQPGDLIRDNIANATCLSPTMSVKLTPQPICNGTGGVTLDFAPNHFGTAPYTYNWTGGVKTQNLPNITTPGTYNVVVKDSNGCTQYAAADVVRGPTAGAGITPNVHMPICCNAYNAPLSLHAAAPQGLTSCQTVYWLRSSAAIATAADVQGFLDTASTANVLKSTNESSISNGTAGAALDVIPAPCTAATSWYYTPVAVQQPHVADSFVYNTTGSTTYSSYGTQIGAYTTIPDQTASPTACDLTDTPSARSLTVTVGSYTGRGSKLRILVLDGSGNVLYEANGLSGAGTYTIPASAIAGDFLGAMKIIAMDYNCTTATGGSTTCTSSGASVSAARKVVFGTRLARSAVASCTPGISIRVDFAPAGCTKLAVATVPAAAAPEALLFPNPATGIVTLKFSAPRADSYRWKITDMLGKALSAQESAFGAGPHEVKLDVSGWAAGVYFVSVGTAGGAATQLKLVVE